VFHNLIIHRHNIIASFTLLTDADVKPKCYSTR